MFSVERVEHRSRAAADPPRRGDTRSVRRRYPRRPPSSRSRARNSANASASRRRVRPLPTTRVIVIGSTGAHGRARARARRPRCDRSRASTATPAPRSTRARPVPAATATDRRARSSVAVASAAAIAVGVGRRRDHQRALAAAASRSASSVGELGGRAAAKLLEDLRDFAADAHAPVGTHRGDVGQRLGQTGRRLVTARPRSPARSARASPVVARPTAAAGNRRTRTGRPGVPTPPAPRAAADGPGTGHTAIPSATARLTTTYPGSLNNGVPASLTERDARRRCASVRCTPVDALAPRCGRDSSSRDRRRCRSVARARAAGGCPRRARGPLVPTPRPRGGPMSSSLPIGSETTNSAPSTGFVAELADRHRNSRVGRREPRRPRSRSIVAAVFVASNATVSAAQTRAAPEHQRIVTEKERAHRRGELVAHAVALERHLDVAPQREQRPVVVVAGHAEHARRAPRDLGVTRELERLGRASQSRSDGRGTRTTTETAIRPEPERTDRAIAAQSSRTGQRSTGPPT